jgi:hypothetical protein
MLTIGKAIQIRPHPVYNEWTIGLINHIEPEDTGHVVCDYWDADRARQKFSFLRDGCQHDRQVFIPEFSEWKNAAKG